MKSEKSILDKSDLYAFLSRWPLGENQMASIRQVVKDLMTQRDDLLKRSHHEEMEGLRNDYRNAIRDLRDENRGEHAAGVAEVVTARHDFDMRLTESNHHFEKLMNLGFEKVKEENSKKITEKMGWASKMLYAIVPTAMMILFMTLFYLVTGKK